MRTNLPMRSFSLNGRQSFHGQATITTLATISSQGSIKIAASQWIPLQR